MVGSNSKYLGDPRPLVEWLQVSVEYPADGWLYIEETVSSIGIGTVCWPKVVKGIDLDDEEYDEIEYFLESSGFKQFLGKDQIEDVVSSLGQQMQEYSESQLIQAINYYWLYDAFIDIGNA